MIARDHIKAVLLCAGDSRRLGGEVAKPWLRLAGKPVMRHALDGLAPHIGGGVVVARADGMAQAAENIPDGWQVVRGGATRALSVRAGLDALASDDAPAYVLIHDAARPFVPAAVVERIITALDDGAAAVIPTLPVADSLKEVDGAVIRTHTPRDNIHATQTPQGFVYDLIHAFHKKNTDENITDDSALFADSAEKVYRVDGDPLLMKITTAGDFALAEKIASNKP